MTRPFLHCILFCTVTLVAMSCKKNNISRNQFQARIDYNNFVETEPPVQTARNVVINALIAGYYEALPAHYQQSAKTYPLLISLPGGGQSGNGGIELPYVLNDGVAQLIAAKLFPANVQVNGSNFSFIVLSPQFSSYPSSNEIASFIDYARKNYRVDTSRMYMTGLSMGGIVTTEFAAAYPSLLAAIVPMSGVLEPQNAAPKCAAIASAKLPVWVFHNTNDPGINASLPRNFVAMINSNNPAVPARLTLFDASVHDSWTAAINPSFKEANKNIYEWMLQYTR